MESCSIAFFVLEANPFRIRGETDQAGNMGLVKEEFNVLNAWREISMPFTVTMFSAKENEKVTNGHRSGLRGFLDFRRPSRWPSKAAGTAFINANT